MMVFFLHSLGVIYCYLVHFEGCVDALPYIYYGSQFFMLLLLTFVSCFFIFDGLIIIYPNIRSLFKTNKESEKLKIK
jgi:hypothetical protein